MPAWEPIIGKDRARLVGAWVLAQSHSDEPASDKSMNGAGHAHEDDDETELLAAHACDASERSPGRRFSRRRSPRWCSLRSSIRSELGRHHLAASGDLARVRLQHRLLMFWACTFGSSAFTALLLSARVKRASRDNASSLHARR